MSMHSSHFHFHFFLSNSDPAMATFSEDSLSEETVSEETGMVNVNPEPSERQAQDAVPNADSVQPATLSEDAVDRQTPGAIPAQRQESGMPFILSEDHFAFAKAQEQLGYSSRRPGAIQNEAQTPERFQNLLDDSWEEPLSERTPPRHLSNDSQTNAWTSPPSERE